MVNSLETDLFAGEGEVRALCRSKNWAETALGPPESWPAALRTVARTALDSPFPINLWCGSDLNLIYNDAYASVLGSKHPAALGAPGALVWHEIWDQIAPMFESIRKGGPPVFAEDAPFIIERQHHRQQAWFTFALSGIRSDDGNVVAFLNVVAETTARIIAEHSREVALAKAERAESRLREVFAQAPAFLAVLRGDDLVFEYVNAAYYQLVGHRELVGRPVFEALPEVRGQGFEQILGTVLETGEPFIGREVPVSISRTPDSIPEERFVDLVYYPITEADGSRSGVVAHGSDVTEHVLARREAQKARTEAEQANHAKSQFLANMSHEIRTPINAVLGYTDLLDAGVAGQLNEGQEAYIERIKGSSRHLLSLVNDVLDLSKIEAGEMLVRIEPTSARDVVQSAIEMVATDATSRGLVLAEEWQCSDGVEVLGDPDRARQIILNLLSNALKFTAAGGTVTVRCRMEDLPAPEAALPDVGPWVILEVEDTGVGIGEEELGRIFQPFFQAETGHTRTIGGTGLGLTISRRFARLMGGDLTVRSTLGAGSCFSLWLAPEAQDRVHPKPVDWPTAPQLPTRPQELPGLGAAGEILLGSTELLEAAIVDLLRVDVHIPVAKSLDRAQLADHLVAQLTVLARTLSMLDRASHDPTLILEGENIQEVLARRHALQRKRLGWSKAELKREYEIVHETTDRVLRTEADRKGVSNMEGALPVVHRLLDRIEEVGLAAMEA